MTFAADVSVFSGTPPVSKPLNCCDSYWSGAVVILSLYCRGSAGATDGETEDMRGGTPREPAAGTAAPRALADYFFSKKIPVSVSL